MPYIPSANGGLEYLTGPNYQAYIKAARAPLLGKLTVFGHSYRVGVHLAGATSVQKLNRATGKLAPLLGVDPTVEQANNFAVDGARLMVQDSSQSNTGGAWAQASSQGGYMAVLNQVIPARAAAPYLSPHGVIVTQFGANDIAFFGGAAGFLAAYQAVLTCCISRMRAGAVYDDGHASITYSGTDWTAFTNNSNVGTGTGAHNTATNNATITINVPSDFEGGAIGFAVIAGNNQFAQHAITVDGTRRADLDFTSSTVNGFDPGSAPYRIMGQRVTGLAAGSHTVQIQVSGISGGATFFDSWWIEANPAPFIVLADQNLPNAYTAYVAPPHVPTDADVQALNAAQRTVAAAFSDARVLTDYGESVLPRTANYWTSDKLHPNERSEALLSDLWRGVIAASTNGATDLSLLATA